MKKQHTILLIGIPVLINFASVVALIQLHIPGTELDELAKFLLGIGMLFGGISVAGICFIISNWGYKKFGEPNLLNLLLPGSLHEEIGPLFCFLVPLLLGIAGSIGGLIGLVFIVRSIWGLLQ